ncbi:bifunctional 2-C-methyl-D-erythritol 4-phosphate cytidylyltransferase/2-C-methyl-D-erythritol 2,4-cyclodiphosphate synthase [soil metagenome]
MPALGYARRMTSSPTRSGATVALIVAAGRGARAGGDRPKQFQMLAGKTVLAHAFDALAAHPDIAGVHLVIGQGREADVRAALGDRQPLSLTVGGATRQSSVRAGLEHLAQAGAPARVLIHDAARPFVAVAVVDRLLTALDAAQGAIPVLPVVDTLARGDGVLGDIVDRSGLHRVQTPQAFAFDAILAAHRSWENGREATDDAQILRGGGHDVTLVEGDRMLEKLTLPEDFAAVEQRLRATHGVRVGMGYDVHRLVEGEELWLCGVQVPHDKGLSGHSDADVALHALVDALLGALADGDIGNHFPPSDPQWRGAASSRFVEYARDRVTARGGTISHVDITLICEAPKVGPHRESMRARVADMLGLRLSRISVKATTTERLGFAGRGEGIAAQAVATLLLPDHD